MFEFRGEPLGRLRRGPKSDERRDAGGDLEPARGLSHFFGRPRLICEMDIGSDAHAEGYNLSAGFDENRQLSFSKIEDVEDAP
jgi:hypothetical protein